MKRKFLVLATTMIIGLTGLVGCNAATPEAMENSIKLENSTNMEELKQVLEKPVEMNIDDYRELSDELFLIQKYDSSDLSLEDLNNRNGAIIIEECIGVVTSSEGDGKILNYHNPEAYYISYKQVEEVKEGDIVLTYFIYNPDTNYEDDILYRFDYIIDRGQTQFIK